MLNLRQNNNRKDGWTLSMDKEAIAKLFKTIEGQEFDVLRVTARKFSRAALVDLGVSRVLSNAKHRYLLRGAPLLMPLLPTLHLDVKSMATNLELAERGLLHGAAASHGPLAQFGPVFCAPGFAERAQKTVPHLSLDTNVENLMYAGIYYLTHAPTDRSLTLQEAAYMHGVMFSDVHVLIKHLHRRLPQLCEQIAFEDSLPNLFPNKE